MNKANLFDIPKIFRSTDTGEYLSNCIMCDKFLLEANEKYFLEKAVKKYMNTDIEDVIFEYAICESCADGAKDNLSKESEKNMMNLFEELWSKSETLPRLISRTYTLDDSDEWLERCAMTDKKIEDIYEYQIVGIAMNKQMEFGLFPFLISGDVGDMVVDVLSAKSKDEMDDWRGKYLGPPDDINELLKDVKFKPIFF